MRKEQVEHYASGQIKFRGGEAEGKPDGPWEFYRLDGSLMRGNYALTV